MCREIRGYVAEEREVHIEILFCGIRHSDMHPVRNEWRSMIPTTYPVVPGHEIVGRVSAGGSSVSRYKAGDLVGVGCLVDSDGTCEICAPGSSISASARARGVTASIFATVAAREQKTKV